MAQNPGINTFHSGNFEVTISNLPTLPEMSDMHMYHNFIRSVSLPGYNQGTYESQWRGEHYLNPLNHKNDNLGDLSITFRINESMMNYFYMAKYIMDIRYEVNDSKAKDPRLKKNVIEAISIVMLDNQKNRIGKVEYNVCLPTSISGLDIDYTNSNEVDFTVTFKFQELFYNLL